MSYFTIEDPRGTKHIEVAASHKTVLKGGRVPVWELILMHATAGVDSRDWLSRTSPNKVSIQSLVWKDGTEFLMVPTTQIAHHAGFSQLGDDFGLNARALGIELENKNDGKDPYPFAQVDRAAWRCVKWWSEFGFLPILSHAQVDTQGKTDPRGFPWKLFYERITYWLGAAFFGQEDFDTETLTVFTEQTTLIANAPRADRILPTRHIQRLCKTYSDDEVAWIVDEYYRVCDAAKIDAVIALAQLAHETAHLNSAWAQPPHHNPAGIGVTGEPGVGVSFPNWQTAIKAHVGRLLAYVVPEDVGVSPAQEDLITVALLARPLPAKLRGAATDIGDLAGTWATDQKYAEKLCRVANAMLSQDITS